MKKEKILIIRTGSRKKEKKCEHSNLVPKNAIAKKKSWLQKEVVWSKGERRENGRIQSRT